MSSFHRVAELAEVAGGDIVAAEVEGSKLVVYQVDGQVRACQRYCIHQGADLCDGLISRGSILCSAHGWRFDAHTGVHERSTQTCLAVYDTFVRGTEIFVDPTPKRNGVPPQ